MMDEKKLAKFSRLPKWAQTEITQLQSRAARAEDQLRRMATHDPSYIRLNDRLGEPEMFLPDGSRIRWETTSRRGRPRDFWFEVYLNQDGDLEILASGPMVLLPQVTNVLQLRERDDL